jgi:imidazolonepropionase-like amidohydrolase
MDDRFLKASLTALLAAAGAFNAGCDRAAQAARAEVGCQGCTVIAGGTVFDGTRAGRGVVVIEGDRVKEVAFGDPKIAAGEMVDAAGKTVLPGLFDMHVHLMADAFPLGGSEGTREHYDDHLKAMLRAGVTSYLDLGSSSRVVFEYRRRIAAGEMLGPRLFAVGPLLTPTGGHPCYAGSPPGEFCIFVDAPADAAPALAKLAPQKPDLVKIVVESGVSHPLPRMTEPSMAAIEKAAEAANLRVIAHVSAAADVEDALQAGVRLFGHVVTEDLISPALAQKMAAAGAVVVPTVAVMDAFDRIGHHKLTEIADPALRDDVPAEVIQALQDPQQLGYMTKPSYAAKMAAFRANAVANVRTLRAAGVTIVSGTDAGNPGTFHGLAMAHELSFYVEAGMSPREALTAATRAPADLLGRHDLGRLEAGAAADVLVVDGDALADIGAVAHVSRVYKAGKRIDREALALPKSTSLAIKPVTNVPVGGTCLHPTECAPHAGCDINHACVPTCGKSSVCAPGSACVSEADAGGAGICFPGDGCDPLAQSCVNGAACVPIGNGATTCWPAGFGAHGAPCNVDGSCAAGSVCDLSNRCADLCDPHGVKGKPCPAGKSCVDASSWAGVPVGMCH